MSGHQHSFVLLFLVIHKLCPAVSLSLLSNQQIPALPALNILMHKTPSGIAHPFSGLLKLSYTSGSDLRKDFIKNILRKYEQIPSSWLEISSTDAMFSTVKAGCVSPSLFSVPSVPPLLLLHSSVYYCCAVHLLENVSGLSMFESPRLLSDNTCPTS